jgi:MoxR-like ATPase
MNDLNQAHLKTDHAASLAAVAERIDTILLGKPQAVRLSLACLIARGHLLLEDLPGMGKTVLAHALAKALGLAFNRVQFTNDMLPGDLTGAAIFNRKEETAANSSSIPARSSRNCCSPTKSTAPRRRRSRPCSKRWRNAR